MQPWLELRPVSHSNYSRMVGKTRAARLLLWILTVTVLEGGYVTAVNAVPVASAVLEPVPATDHVTLSVGSVLLIISFSVLAVYFIGGMLFRRFIGGATGYEVIPNSDFWNDLPLLIKDGALYAFSGCRPEVVYERI